MTSQESEASGQQMSTDRVTDQKETPQEADRVMDEQEALGQQLVNAAEEGNVEKVQELLVAGMEVNTPGKWGSTALYIAAMNGNLQCLEVLITAGAQLEEKQHTSECSCREWKPRMCKCTDCSWSRHECT